MTVETSDSPATTAGATGTRTTTSAAAAISATVSIALKPVSSQPAGPSQNRDHDQHRGRHDSGSEPARDDRDR